MKAVLLPNGNLLVPKRAEAEGYTGLIGDSLVEVAPGTPDYEEWMRYYRLAGLEPQVREEARPE